MNDFEIEILAQIKHYLDTMINCYSIPRIFDKPSEEYESQGMYIAFTTIKCFVEYLESFYFAYQYNKEFTKNDQI